MFHVNNQDNKKELITDYPTGSVVAVIDMDTVLYPVAAKGDERLIVVSNGVKERRFKNRTDFKKLCAKNDWNYDSFDVKDLLIPEPVSYCLSNLKNCVKNIKEQIGATHVEIYIGGTGNFRENLPLPNRYKYNRKDMIKPTHLKACQEYAINHMGAIIVNNMETDDMVSIRSIEINKIDGVKAVLVTTDKDALQTFSAVNYVYRQDKLTKLDSEIGSIYLDDKGNVKGTGLKFLISQVLVCGDTTDGYLPRNHFKTKYGVKAYYTDVKDFKDVRDFLEFMVVKWISLVGLENTFLDWNGNQQVLTWLELAELYWKCAYMLTSLDDDTTFEKLLNDYGVSYEKPSR